MTSIAVMPPSASASSTPTIAGKALYLELVNNPDAPTGSLGYWYKGGVRQIIIFPEHLDAVGKVQPPQLWERVVSAHSPRSQWNHEYLNRLTKKPDAETLANSTDYHFSYDTYTTDEVSAMTDREKHEAYKFTLDQRLKGYFVDTYSATDEAGERIQAVAQLWVLRDSKPLAIEVTDEELSQVRSYTTPQSAIRRIQKARLGAGFPEKIA
jgi:hypothetical protein